MDAAVIDSGVTDAEAPAACTEQSCLNGGSCLATASGHECACVLGFMGDACEINIDDCPPHACQNEGSCEDGVTTYSCRCLPGYAGPTCDVRPSPQVCGAEPGALAWTKNTVSGSGFVSSGADIALRSDGSTVVIGAFRGAATFGSGEARATTLTSAGMSDAFVASYDPVGALAWVSQAVASAIDVATFADGSAVVSGSFVGTATFGVNGDHPITLEATDGGSAFVIKYAHDGSIAWVARTRSVAGGHATAHAVAALEDGSVLFAGELSRATTFGAGEPNETILASASDSSSDAFFAKLGPSGELAWAKHMYGSSNAAGIVGLPDGSGLVTGTCFSEIVFDKGEAGPTTHYCSNSAFLARVAADGRLVWVRSAGDIGAAVPQAIAALPDGTAWVTGRFEGTAFFGFRQPGELIAHSAGGYDAFLSRYAPDGVHQWTQVMGSIGDDVGRGIGVQHDGLSVIVGSFQDSLPFDRSGSETTLTGAGLGDLFLAQYTPGGAFVWAQQAGGSLHDAAGGVAVLPDGSAIVAGQIDSAAFIARFDSCGHP